MSKHSLSLVKGNSYFTTGIFSAGIYQYNNNIVLIDSGSDETSAKNIYNAIQSQNYVPIAIINTHCHPDHCGGNYYFQKLFPNLKTYATHNEKIFIENQDLAARCFCSNAAPFAGLKNKHITLQKPSSITNIISYEDHVITIDNINLKIITLSGHTPGSIGIITPDNILYCGDALFGEETFNKHPMLFYTDIEKTLNSFKKLSNLTVDACVLYHGGVVFDLIELVKKHEIRILETKDIILKIIKENLISIDLLTQKIMIMFSIPSNIIAFTLTQTTTKAYLTKLESENLIELVVYNGLLQSKIK